MLITFDPCGLIYRSVENTELLNENIGKLKPILAWARMRGHSIVVTGRYLYGNRQVRELELMLDTLELPYDRIISVEEVRTTFEEDKSVDFADNITFLSSQIHYPLQALSMCSGLLGGQTMVVCVTGEHDIKVSVAYGKVLASTSTLSEVKQKLSLQ